MVRSVMERNVDAMVVGGIGQHAFEVARRKMKIYDGRDILLSEVTEKMKNGTLRELDNFNHSHHDRGVHSSRTLDR